MTLQPIVIAPCPIKASSTTKVQWLRPRFVNKRGWEETFEEVGGSHPVHQLDSTKRRGGSLEKELARGARSLIHPLFLQPSNCG